MQFGAFDRFIMATDTPTGSGIMPLGMLYTIAHCASLTDMPPERFICAASGNNARVYGLDSGYLAAGKAADIVLIDAPDGGTQSTALAAIKHGDIAAIGAVVTRRRSALRRPQPQHAGHDPQGAGPQVTHHAGFRGRRSLNSRPATRKSATLVHDPEKWNPVFRKDHAPPKC